MQNRYKVCRTGSGFPLGSYREPFNQLGQGSSEASPSSGHSQVEVGNWRTTFTKESVTHTHTLSVIVSFLMVGNGYTTLFDVQCIYRLNNY